MRVSPWSLRQFRDSGLKVQGLGSWVKDLVFGVRFNQDLGLRVSGIRVQGSGFRGLGLRV